MVYTTNRKSVLCKLLSKRYRLNRTDLFQNKSETEHSGTRDQTSSSYTDCESFVGIWGEVIDRGWGLLDSESTQVRTVQG